MGGAAFNRPLAPDVRSPSPHGERTASATTSDLRLLRYFVAVAEELHFGRAATRLGIAQPPLSTAIRTLERQLGAELFRRTSRSVELTAAGEALLRGGRRVIAVYNETLADIADQVRSDAGRLRVAVDPSTLSAATALVREFGRSHPRVALELSSLRWGDGAADVGEGRVDVAILRLPVEGPGIETRLLFEEPRVAVLNASHPLARRDALTVADLRGEPLILLSGTLGGWRGTLAVVAGLGDRAHPATAVAASMEELVIRVAAGQCVAVVPESLAGGLRQAGFVDLPLRDGPTSSVALVWRRGVAVASLGSFVQTALDVCFGGHLAAG